MNESPSTVTDPQDWIEISEIARLPERPVVSVLMATFNHGLYLAEAIEGILLQRTNFPFELLIGEDCSTDNTREIAIRYQHENPHLIRIITSGRNVGMHDNAERLIRSTRGEYIAFCEGDDYWIDPTKLQKQVNVLRTRSDVTAVYSDFVISDFRGGHWVVDFTANAFANLRVSDLRGNIRGNPIDGRLRTLTSVFRSAVLKKLYERKLPMKTFPFLDLFIFVQAASSGNVERIDSVTAVYRRSPRSATRSDPKTNLLLLQSIRKFLEQIHVFFPEIQRIPRATFRNHDIAICRAAYIAGNVDAFENAYSRLRSDDQPVPLYFGVLRWIMKWENMRRFTVNIRLQLRKAKSFFQ